MKESKLILKGQLSAKVIRKNGKVEVKGVISKKVVTDAGVAYLVDSFQDSTSTNLNQYVSTCSTSTCG